MRLLVVNGGSSSVKFAVFESKSADGTAAPRAVFTGELTGIGGDAELKVQPQDGEPRADRLEVGDVVAGFGVVLQAIQLAGEDGLDAVGYRVVHPGPRLKDHQLITPEVLRELDAAAAFAPLHDPAVTAVIRAGMVHFPDLPHFACFDTVFHETMPEEATTYPLPLSLRDQGVRRYGFHGLSVESVVWQMQQSDGTFPVRERMIVAHLGSGCSVTALLDGKSVDTSMGLTPDGGVVMGTRPGDLDPGLVLYLLRQHPGDEAAAAKAVEDLLNHKAGLVGLTGMHNDMRAIRKAADEGDSTAALALKLFTRSITRAIGGCAWLLGGLDTIIFTGGIGEHDAATRAEVLSNLREWGVRLSRKANERQAPAPRRIQSRRSWTEVLIIPAEEDLMIALHVARMLQANDGQSQTSQAPTETTGGTEPMQPTEAATHAATDHAIEHAPYAPSASLIEALSADELRRVDAYWRACNYCCAGMLYLLDNPLLREPLKPEHIKNRLLGHWGSDPGQTFTWVHLNRLIKKYDLNMIYVSGPGHGAPATLSNCYLEGVYSEVYPAITEDVEGMRKFFKQFSFPGGIGSHCTPETPGSIHEGGELGYSLSHGFGAAFDNPDLIVTVVVGDGEAETGPLATSWHANKFLNPVTDGAVLPVLHLNGYKIANPTILARIPHEELEALFFGYGWQPYFVEIEGDYEADIPRMHKKMAATLEQCVLEIKQIQQQARDAARGVTNGGTLPTRPRWPMIVLRSPKGWTGPKVVDGHQVEGNWRAHQIPILEPKTHPEQLKQVEQWLRSYRPEELFDEQGKLIDELRAMAPEGLRRITANPHANGGLLLKPLNLPDFRKYALDIEEPGQKEVSSTATLGDFLADIIQLNPTSFRVFGPDETASNKLQATYMQRNEFGGKTWEAELEPIDMDGTWLSRSGRVMEMLSEHTLEGWFEGYVLTGRHGFFSSYEAFIHIIDSMINQHAKWLEKSKLELRWRAPIASINLLITSLVWRQDHNGFTHQDPGFLDIITNKSPEVTRIYLPPDANCLLSVADHCLRSTNYINVIVADKAPHLQYLGMVDAINHCTKGIGIWDFASTDAGHEPDVVMACAGDIPTAEGLAATAILREHCPDIRIRFINVVDLFRLMPEREHPHGMEEREFDSLFTIDKPVIFNFHAYASLIHKLTYRRQNHANFHVRGYKEKGNINTPLELAILNQVDRFDLAIDVIDRVPRLQATAAHLKEWLKNQIIESVNYAHEHGQDRPEIREWKWPLAK